MRKAFRRWILGAARAVPLLPLTLLAEPWVHLEFFMSSSHVVILSVGSCGQKSQLVFSLVSRARPLFNAWLVYSNRRSDHAHHLHPGVLHQRERVLHRHLPGGHHPGHHAPAQHEESGDGRQVWIFFLVSPDRLVAATLNTAKVVHVHADDHIEIKPAHFSSVTRFFRCGCKFRSTQLHAV